MKESVIDWNEIWRVQQLERIESSHTMDCASIWETKEAAQRYWKMSQESNAKRIRITIENLALTPDSRVLDVGAGPGTLAIPIAMQAAHVTAVEPSNGMMTVMKEFIDEWQISNILCIQKRWEDVNIQSDLKPPYDVVIASYSLGMEDIEGAIQMMVNASSKYVYLYWFAGETAWETRYRDIWPALHGAEYHPGPKCDVLYNVLYQMGIYPNIEVFPLKNIQRFSSLDEAVNDLRTQYQITNPSQESILRDYLQGILEEEDGSLILRGSSTRVNIWWEVKSGS
jgi:hypothetical protein